MNPNVDIKTDNNDVLTFTMSNINVSLANALRRTILSDIPIIIIRSHPYEKNDVIIHRNTSRLNNEILKQRLSCIPIYIRDRLTLSDLSEYEVEIDKKNNSDAIEYITTEDFTIKHKGKLLKDNVVHKIFPPDPITKDYILFARLRPKISEDIPGEELKITAKMSWGSAGENGMFNVVSTCAYAMTPDISLQHDKWDIEEQKLHTKGMEEIDIEYEKENWLLGEGKRIYIKDSFDFILETLGVLSNKKIIHYAIEILHNKLNALQEQIENGTLPIKKNNGTSPNTFDLTLPNEDYTIGKSLEFILYQHYYISHKTLAYIGFLKKHPHDKDSIIRMSFKENVEETTPLQYLSEAIKKAQEIFATIESLFS